MPNTFKQNDRWLLPEGIDELLPEGAERLEQLRRELLDQFHSWGYELVIPPMIEFLDSLLIGTGDDLAVQTFTLVDQISGKQMGVRADMTPQVARIDAHGLKRNTPTRLCYLGSVLHTQTDGFAASRSPMQIGAELFGHQGVESDFEVLQLMLQVLRLAGVQSVHVDIGHVGIFRGLAQQAGLDSEQEATLFDALQRKAKPEIASYLDEWSIASDVKAMIAALADLNGTQEVLSTAATVLKQGNESVKQALQSLQKMAEMAEKYLPGTPLHYDLAELRGYHYHTGVVFAAYVPGQGKAIAQGGRYDDIGKVFGRARPATGFSADLKNLIALSAQQTAKVSAIWAPAEESQALFEKVATLRAAGERVVMALPGQEGGAKEMGCDQQLVLIDAEWQVVEIESN